MENLLSASTEFVEMFEAVFGNDWDLTKDRIKDPAYVEPKGTFVNPGVEDEDNNWANRGSLLRAYRSLKQLLIQAT